MIMKSKEDILRKHYELKTGKSCDKTILNHLDYVLIAMEEYANQPKENSLDREVEDLIDNTNDKKYCIEEETIMNFINGTGLNPMLQPNATEDIVNYVNGLHKLKVKQLLKSKEQSNIGEWVSIEDSPKENGIYLIVHYDSVDEAHFRNGEWYSTDRPIVNQNAFVKTYSRAKLNDITHWQPLPKPPTN